MKDGNNQIWYKYLSSSGPLPLTFHKLLKTIPLSCQTKCLRHQSDLHLKGPMTTKKKWWHLKTWFSKRQSSSAFFAQGAPSRSHWRHSFPRHGCFAWPSRFKSFGSELIDFERCCKSLEVSYKTSSCTPCWDRMPDTRFALSLYLRRENEI